MYHHIICGFSGVGKSTAEQMHKNVVDFESSAFSHEWKPSDMGIKNPTFPRNYIDAVVEHMGQHHNCIYLLSCHEEVREELKSRDFEYIIVMPELNQRNEYVKRWLRRGSTEEFIARMYDRWESMIVSCQNDPAPKIYLKENEYLNDVLPL